MGLEPFIARGVSPHRQRLLHSALSYTVAYRQDLLVVGPMPGQCCTIMRLRELPVAITGNNLEFAYHLRVREENAETR